MGGRNEPSPPRMPRFPPVSPAGCGCGAAPALPGGGRRSHPGPTPLVVVVGGCPAALRPPPRPALARRSLAVSRLPPLPSTPPAQSPFPSQPGWEGKGAILGGGSSPPTAPHPPRRKGAPLPLPGAALVYVKNFPFLKRAMPDGVGRCHPPRLRVGPSAGCLKAEAERWGPPKDGVMSLLHGAPHTPARP